MSPFSHWDTRAASQLPTSRNETPDPLRAVKRRTPPRRPTAEVARRRRAALAAIAVALAAIVVVVVASSIGSAGPVTQSSSTEVAEAPGRVRVVLDGRTVADQPTSRLSGHRSLTALIARIPATTTVGDGPAKVRVRTDRRGLARDLKGAIAAGGGDVTVPSTAVAATIQVPVVKQTLQDDCEATALSMLLRFAGKRVDQLTLQRQVARNGPLDPEEGPEGEVWGNPRLGFVGRADGSGTAGGFGVYQGPIAALARRHGVETRDLTRKSPDTIYRTLLSGKPVLVWVGLSEGPYGSWHSPAGKVVTVNYGEHAVLLTGVNGEAVTVNDPLSGERLTWPKSQFEAMWNLLGRRALAA
jgi:uncharacterized protein YvpB